MAQIVPLDRKWINEIEAVAKATPKTFVGMSDQAVICVSAIPRLVAKVRELEALLDARGLAGPGQGIQNAEDQT